MTPSQDWTSGLPLCFYASRRPFRVMRRTCARPPATPTHLSVTEVEPTLPTRSLKEWVQCRPHPPGHQAGFPGWLVTLCPLQPSPCHLFKPPKVPCPGKPTWTDSPIQTSLCASRAWGQHPVPSPDQQCTKAVSISPTLSPSTDEHR